MNRDEAAKRRASSLERLAAEAQALKTDAEHNAFARKLIDEYDFAPMEASVFIYLEKYGRDGETTAPL
jgi:hypothetical protein